MKASHFHSPQAIPEPCTQLPSTPSNPTPPSSSSWHWSLSHASCIAYGGWLLLSLSKRGRQTDERNFTSTMAKLHWETCVCVMLWQPDQGVFIWVPPCFPGHRAGFTVCNIERWVIPHPIPHPLQGPRKERKEREKEKNEKRWINLLTKMAICGASAADCLSHEQNADEILPRKREETARQRQPRRKSEWTPKTGVSAFIAHSISKE